MFSTTGGRTLQQLNQKGNAFFIPNPIDASLTEKAAYELEAKYDLFFAGRKGEGNQWTRALSLRTQAPEFRYCFVNPKKPLWGASYLSTLAECRVGLNFSIVEGEMYASDRMAQYLEAGLLLVTDRASGYANFFSDEEMIFYSNIEDIMSGCREALADDAEWRRRANKSRERALQIMSSELVCKFIENTTFQKAQPNQWVFGGC